MLRSFAPRGLLATLLFTTAACTQTAANIDLRGQNSYGRSGTKVATNSYSKPYGNSGAYSSYAPAAGVSSQTSSSASVQSIGVSDLTPPSASGTPAASKNSSKSLSPFKAASTVDVPASKPVELKPLADASPVDVKPTEVKPLASANINPWTHTPRTTAASEALDQSFNLSPKGKTATAAKEQMVSDVKPIADQQKSAALDSIVSQDDEATVQKTVSITKKMKSTEMASSSGFMWPVNSKKILSEFGPKGKGKVNDGINIASAEGEPVWAAADGEVVYVGNELQGYGNMVLIKHSGNKTSTYAHLGRYTIDKYERVKQGDIIGYVGNSGNVKEPQLHFAIRDGKDAVDPLKYLNRNVASLH